MPGWVRPYLIGVLSTVLVTGSVLLLSRPASPAVEVLIATPSAGTITVAISGEVARPGLYTLPPGRRVADLIERAGGTTERADPAAPSRALLLRDEMHIHVPAATVSSGPAVPAGAGGSAPALGVPAASTPTPGAAEVAGGPGATPAPAGGVTAPAETSPTATPLRVETPAASAPTAGPTTPAPGGPINVNTASAADLERLPGIGTVLAARIVADRERNGPFRRVDDLERVSGIGPTLLARLRPLVTV